MKKIFFVASVLCSIALSSCASFSREDLIECYRIERLSSAVETDTEPSYAGSVLSDEEQLKKLRADTESRNVSAVIAFLNKTAEDNRLAGLGADVLSLSSEVPQVFQDALDMLSLLRIETVSVPFAPVKNTPFKEAYELRLVWSDTGEIAAGVPVTVRYPVSGANDIYDYTSETFITGSDGFVRFMPPVPGFSCRSAVSARVFSLHDEWTCSAPYEVTTDIKGKPIAIAITDFDKNGKPVTTNSKSAAALLTAFMQRGYTRVGTADFTQFIIKGNENTLYAEAKKVFGNTIPYMIYGTVKYDTAEKTAGGFTVKLSADIAAVDLRTNEVLYETSAASEVFAKTEAAALDGARKNLIAEELTDRLIYGI